MSWNVRNLLPGRRSAQYRRLSEPTDVKEARFRKLYKVLPPKGKQKSSVSRIKTVGPSISLRVKRAIMDRADKINFFFIPHKDIYEKKSGVPLLIEKELDTVTRIKSPKWVKDRVLPSDKGLDYVADAAREFSQAKTAKEGYLSAMKAVRSPFGYEVDYTKESRALGRKVQSPVRGIIFKLVDSNCYYDPKSAGKDLEETLQEKLQDANGPDKDLFASSLREEMINMVYEKDEFKRMSSDFHPKNLKFSCVADYIKKPDGIQTFNSKGLIALKLRCEMDRDATAHLKEKASCIMTIHVPVERSKSGGTTFLSFPKDKIKVVGAKCKREFKWDKSALPSLFSAQSPKKEIRQEEVKPPSGHQSEVHSFPDSAKKEKIAAPKMKSSYTEREFFIESAARDERNRLGVIRTRLRSALDKVKHFPPSEKDKSDLNRESCLKSLESHLSELEYIDELLSNIKEKSIGNTIDRIMSLSKAGRMRVGTFLRDDPYLKEVFKADKERNPIHTSMYNIPKPGGFKTS